MPKQLTLIIIALVLLTSLAALLSVERRPHQPASKTGQPVDATLDISVTELKARLQQGEDILLVDVRPAKEFAVVHLPDSINIPLYLLKKKEHLKSQPVVLINEGYARQELEQECHRLRPLGFTKLAILTGGLVAWQQSGSQLQGDPFEARKLVSVPARTFFLERAYANRLVVDIGAAPTGGDEGILPEAIHLSDDGGQSFIANLKQRIAEQDPQLPPSVLLINGNGQGYEALDQRLKSAGLGPIFYLQGGRESYEAFLNSQALLRQPQKLSTDNKTCPTCP